MDVADVRYLNDHGSETLHIVIDRHNTIVLRIKPEIRIEQIFDAHD